VNGHGDGPLPIMKRRFAMAISLPINASASASAVVARASRFPLSCLVASQPIHYPSRVGKPAAFFMTD